MKRFFSMLLVAVMLMTCMATVAFASEPGDTITFSFVVSGNTTGFGAYGGALSYDSSVLTLNSIAAGEKSAGGFFVGNADNGKVTFANATDVTGDGVLFTATFTVNEGAAPGTYPVYFALDNFANTSGGNPGATIGGGGNVVIDAPETEPTEPETEPTEPETEPTEPETEPTEPETEPTKPETEPTEPTQKPEDLDPVPDTGDITPYIAMGVFAVLALGFAVVFVFKRNAAK